MNPALETIGLGRRYGRTWALRECAMQIPEGSVTALVGPNGAGKTTLLHVAVGVLAATEGEVRVLGESMRGQRAELLARIGFVAQDTPLYRNFSVRDMLRFGRSMNPAWDRSWAQARIEQLSIPVERACGRLSGGQQAQVALVVAVAKRPELLLLDEPIARLDPLARREFLELLMETVAEGRVTVMLSSHLIADLQRFCDHLVVLAAGRVVVAGATDALLAEHHHISGPRERAGEVTRDHAVIDSRGSERQVSMLVRGNGVVNDAGFEVNGVDLEELVLAYLRRPAERSSLTALSGGGPR